MNRQRIHLIYTRAHARVGAGLAPKFRTIARAGTRKRARADVHTRMRGGAYGGNGMFARETVSVIRTYRSGRIGEKIKFPLPEKERRGRKNRRSSLRKMAQNENSAVRRLARLLNEYFGPDCWLIGLDYGPEGYMRVEERARGLFEQRLRAPGEEPVWEDCMLDAADHEAGLCLRRVNRELKKRGLDNMRYVLITSDMDGKTGEAVRVHHHICVSAGAKDIIVGKWGLGGVDYEPMWDEPDHYALAEYLIEQVRRRPDAKKYTPSRNMPMPPPKDRTVYTDAELRAPQGAFVLYRSEWKRGGVQYLRYILPAGAGDGVDGEEVSAFVPQAEGS